MERRKRQNGQIRHYCIRSFEGIKHEQTRHKSERIFEIVLNRIENYFNIVFYSLIFVIQDDGVPAIDCAFLCAHVLLNIYDEEYGGFGSSSATNPNSPKFPEPSNLNFLLSMHVLSTSTMLVEMSLNASLNTLRKMSFGGLHDHVGKVRLCFHLQRANGIVE